MSTTELAIVVIVATGLLLLGLLCVVQSFGRYTRRIVESNARTRQSCEASAQRARRSEERAAEAEVASIELMRELVKSTQERSA
jgi:hypothetical protein